MGMGRARNFGGPDVSDGGVVGSSHHLAGALVASLALSSRRALSLADNGQVFFSKKMVMLSWMLFVVHTRVPT